MNSVTDGVHEAAVNVGVEQVGHGQDGAVSKGSQTTGHSPFTTCYSLPVILHLAAVVQQVHEEREVPERHTTNRNLLLKTRRGSLDNT